MSRRRAKILSERELEVMNAVWNLGKASVKEIRSAMGGEKAGAYTSIATMLKFLESKGALRHEQQGRTFYYSSCTSKEYEQDKAMRYILANYFGGNVNRMLTTLNSSINLNQDERITVAKVMTTE
jgi:BlaI family transcriptional regulator, penicillinase repressor